MNSFEMFAEKHLEKLEPIIAQQHELIKNKLDALCKKRNRPKVIRKFIKALNLQSLFVGIGVVRIYIHKKGFGFIDDLKYG